MKVSDVDMSKESLPVQEFVDNVRSLLNSGGFEIEVTAASNPGTAPQETKIVLSLFGAQFRLYVSYLGEWYYVTLSKL